MPAATKRIKRREDALIEISSGRIADTKQAMRVMKIAGRLPESGTRGYSDVWMKIYR
jgi:hypothetical protein